MSSHSVATAVTAGSATAFASVAAAHDGGYVARSFDPQDGTITKVSMFMSLDSDVRAALLKDHTLFPGAYGITSKGNTRRVIHVMLVTDGIDNREGKVRDVFVVHCSNVASQAKIGLVARPDLTGSTIWLVKESFGKTLPANWPLGVAFDDSTATVPQDIRDMLPAKGKKYQIALNTNAAPVLAGAQTVAKGSLDEAMDDHMKDVSPYHAAWAHIHAHDGGVPFSKDFQTLVVDNKVELGNHYPPHFPVVLTDTPYVILRNAPLDDDKKDTILLGIRQVEGILKRARVNNLPVPRRTPMDVTLDGESTGGFDLKSPTLASSQARDSSCIEAKLRLMCIGFSPDGGIFLFELRDKIKRALAAPKSQ